MLLCALILVKLLMFGELGYAQHYTYPLAFLAVPVIIWAAMRFGQYGATAATVATVLIAVISTVKGIGPLTNPDMLVSLNLKS